MKLQQGEVSRTGGPEPRSPQPADCLCLDFPICTMDLHSFIHSTNVYVSGLVLNALS